MAGIILASLFAVLAAAQIMYWRTEASRINDYSQAVLERSVTLLQQANDIAAREAKMAHYPSCSEADLNALRTLLWNYQLIKDVGRTSARGILCTALWGRLPIAQPLTATESFVGRNGARWLLNLPLTDSINVSAWWRNDLLVIFSPFIFARFEKDAATAHYSAVITNSQHNHRWFTLGPTQALLTEADATTHYAWYFITREQCNRQYDLCVIAGTHPYGLLQARWYTLALLTALGLGLGILICTSLVFYRRKKTSLPTRLENALKNGEMRVVYQPIYEIETGRMKGMEALLRWHDNNGDAISPDLFIPLAEKEGLMAKITEFVTTQAVGEMAELLNRYDLTLSINISLADLFSHHYFDFLTKLTQKIGLPPSRIMLEITERENATLAHMEAAILLFKRHGFLIALDDFGTGYSTISWLSRLPIDEVKVDKSITDAIGTPSLNKTLLVNLILMLKAMPQQIVFEGLEQRLQVDYLQDNFPGCYGQGWWFSRPVDSQALRLLLTMQAK
ncbi:EAL domain-containing protein [Cronobacter muytjensii]|uniref:cyclic-guanylate-specific phosphodiesterase n=1 Tax=Cronobacter muytjensii TaxID=413501 RepID=A0A2T7AWF0_9ENTR|nr:EAL domain-containing protein [Cronobacter muytjensii]KAB0884809.1 EAL domain-containing protein [Cronobacter muytjensii]MBF4812144.1 EAL domain-containing protein [Cronobacter muytjensii]PUX16499.1 cyclic diguanylate phosphodiesterase [Cronobacter muytjensii]